MTTVLENLLYMSACASIAAIAVLLIRHLLKHAPRVFSYILWGVVLFRLLCPVQIETAISVVPSGEQFSRAIYAAPVQQRYNSQATPVVFDTPAPTAFNQETAAPSDSTAGQAPVPTDDIIFPVQNLQSAAPELPVNTQEALETADIPVMSVNTSDNSSFNMENLFGAIWLLGAVLLLAYGVISYEKLKQRVCFATRVSGNIYETDMVSTPMVVVIFRPRIIVPVNTDINELDYVIEHERTHIKRFDHIVKLLMYTALCIHWFNPIVWVFYVLMTKDMEMSCDEQVILRTGRDVRREYSCSLLAFATCQSGLLIPLAFGESNTRERVNNIMKCKKPTIWILIGSVVVCLAVAAILIGTRGTPGFAAKNPFKAFSYKSAKTYVGGQTVSGANYYGSRRHGNITGDNWKNLCNMLKNVEMAPVPMEYGNILGYGYESLYFDVEVGNISGYAKYDSRFDLVNDADYSRNASYAYNVDIGFCPFDEEQIKQFFPLLDKCDSEDYNASEMLYTRCYYIVNEEDRHAVIQYLNTLTLESEKPFTSSKFGLFSNNVNITTNGVTYDNECLSENTSPEEDGSDLSSMKWRAAQYLLANMEYVPDEEGAAYAEFEKSDSYIDIFSMMAQGAYVRFYPLKDGYCRYETNATWFSVEHLLQKEFTTKGYVHIKNDAVNDVTGLYEMYHECGHMKVSFKLPNCYIDTMDTYIEANLPTDTKSVTVYNAEAKPLLSMSAEENAELFSLFISGLEKLTDGGQSTDSASRTVRYIYEFTMKSDQKAVLYAFDAGSMFIQGGVSTYAEKLEQGFEGSVEHNTDYLNTLTDTLIDRANSKYTYIYAEKGKTNQADVDSDGKADKLTLNETGSLVSVAWGNGKATVIKLTEQATIGENASKATAFVKLTLADTNGDKKNELVMLTDSALFAFALSDTGEASQLGAAMPCGAFLAEYSDKTLKAYRYTGVSRQLGDPPLLSALLATDSPRPLTADYNRLCEMLIHHLGLRNGVNAYRKLSSLKMPINYTSAPVDFYITTGEGGLAVAVVEERLSYPVSPEEMARGYIWRTWLSDGTIKYIKNDIDFSWIDGNYPQPDSKTAGWF